MLIAHRGVVNDTLKENTIPAFKAAIKSNKYAGFELDIYTTKDNVFVIHHDLLLDGKFIWKYTYPELKKKGIPKLEDVLKLKTNKIILIEIKDLNIDTNKLTKLLNKYKNKNIYVISFFTSVIKKFKERTFKIGILDYILNSSNSYDFDFIGILYSISNNHLINTLKNNNIEVFIYGINRKDNLKYNNVYYIIDNYI